MVMSGYVNLDDMRADGWRIANTADPRVKIGTFGANGDWRTIVRDDASGWGWTGSALMSRAEAFAAVAATAAHYYGTERPAVPSAREVLAGLLAACWEIEESDGSWAGSDVVDMINGLFDAHGFDIAHPAESSGRDRDDYSHDELLAAALASGGVR